MKVRLASLGYTTLSVTGGLVNFANPAVGLLPHPAVGLLPHPAVGLLPHPGEVRTKGTWRYSDGSSEQHFPAINKYHLATIHSIKLISVSGPDL